MTRRLILAMPGKRQHQQGVWRLIESEGLADHTDICLQVNPYGIQNKSGWPDHADISKLPEIMRSSFARELARDWMPKHPDFWYVNHEPRYEDPASGVVQNWMWQAWRDGYTDRDAEFVAALSESCYAAAKESGLEHAAGSIYGIPLTLADSGPTVALMERYQSAAKILAPFDWVFLNMYPRGVVLRDGVTSQTAERHAIRARTTYLTAVGMYSKPTVPFLFFNWDRRSVPDSKFDPAEYAAVYAESLASVNCERLGIWMNAHNATVTDWQLDDMRAALPSLRAFVGVSR